MPFSCLTFWCLARISKISTFLRTSWEPARPLQRSFGPFGPEIIHMPRESRKCLPGPPAPEPRKVSKKSREQSGKSRESLRKVPKVFSDCSRDFLEMGQEECTLAGQLRTLWRDHPLSLSLPWLPKLHAPQVLMRVQM